MLCNECPGPNPWGAHFFPFELLPSDATNIPRAAGRHSRTLIWHGRDFQPSLYCEIKPGRHFIVSILSWKNSWKAKAIFLETYTKVTVLIWISWTLVPLWKDIVVWRTQRLIDQPTMTQKKGAIDCGQELTTVNRYEHWREKEKRGKTSWWTFVAVSIAQGRKGR